MDRKQLQTKMLPQLFRKVELSESDTLQGQLLGSLNEQFLSNMRVDIAQEILNHTYSENKDEKYGLILAEKQGQLELLTYILDLSTEANNTLFNIQQNGEQQ